MAPILSVTKHVGRNILFLLINCQFSFIRDKWFVLKIISDESADKMVVKENILMFILARATGRADCYFARDKNKGPAMWQMEFWKDQNTGGILE